MYSPGERLELDPALWQHPDNPDLITGRQSGTKSLIGIAPDSWPREIPRKTFDTRQHLRKGTYDCDQDDACRRSEKEPAGPTRFPDGGLA
jgi:hypothetical protein